MCGKGYSDINRYENVESDTEGTSSTIASDEASKQENLKFRWINNPATRPVVMSRNVRD